jgi:hypothetical protein
MDGGGGGILGIIVIGFCGMAVVVLERMEVHCRLPPCFLSISGWTPWSISFGGRQEGGFPPNDVIHNVVNNSGKDPANYGRRDYRGICKKCMEAKK